MNISKKKPLKENLHLEFENNVLAIAAILHTHYITYYRLYIPLLLCFIIKK